jgi:hypothetical protein
VRKVTAFLAPYEEEGIVFNGKIPQMAKKPF